MEHKLLARHPIGNPRRLWRQNRFLLSIANPGPMGLSIDDELQAQKTRRAVKTCTDAGFNLLECLWASPRIGREIVRTAETLGNQVLFQDLTRFGGMGLDRVFCEKNDLAGAMQQMRPWDCIAGFYMWDEPCTEEQMRTVHDMIAECEREYPEKLPFTVAVPSLHPLFRWQEENFAPYIDRFADIIDPVVLSFDYYPVGMTGYNEDEQLDTSYLWHDLEIVRRAAQKRGLPMWFYYQGQKYHFYNCDCRFHHNMVRAMAHAGILHGVKGLQLYTEFEGPVNPENGGPGIFFEAQKQLNAEFCVLGNTLMALTCQRVIHDDTILPDCPIMAKWRTPMEESELLTGKLQRRISVSEHSDAYGNRYLMVLNRDFDQDTSIQLTLKQPSHVYKVSREDGEQTLVFSNTTALLVHLNPGDLALYRIQPGEEAPFTVEYVLEKE